MPDARTDRAWRRPLVRLGFGVALLAVCVAAAWGAPDELGVGSLRLSDAPATTPEGAELVVQLSGRGELSPTQAAFQTSQDVVETQLESDPAIVGVEPTARGGDVALLVEFGDVSSAEREEVAERLEREIDPGALRARVDGEVVRSVEVREELEGELWRNELVALPAALLVLIAAAGWRRAVAPVLCAAIAIAGPLALLRLIGTFADVSLLGFAPAAVVGLLLGVELPLRALRAADAPERDTRLALAVAGVASLPGFALLATPLDQAASLALGAAFAAFLAVVATRLVVPPVVVLTAPGEPAAAGVATPAGERGGWRRRARAVSRIAVPVALVGLCALAVPTFVYGATAPYVALDASLGAPLRSFEDSLVPDLPLAAALAAAAVAPVLAWLARTPLALLLGPLSMLPAGAALGVCTFLAENGNELGRSDAEGAFLDTGAVAIAACAIVAISCARSALAANAFSVGRQLELRPAVAGTIIGVAAAAALYLATDIDQADELAVAVAIGLVVDLLLLRLPLRPLAGRWVGSPP